MANKPYAVVMALRAVNMATKPVNAVRSSLKSLRGQAAVTARALGMHKVVNSIKRVKRSIGGLGSSVRRLGSSVGRLLGPFAALAGAFSVGAMASLVNSTAQAGDALSKMAERTGMSVEQLQEWEFAARRGGMETTEFKTAIRDLTKNVGEAVNGTGEGKVVFDALGISLRDSMGHVRDSNDIMLDLADRMEAIPDAATRSAIAQKLFGESGGKMVVALKGGREELAALFDEQKKYGQLTEQQAKDSADFVDQTTNLGEAWGGVMKMITANLMPVLSPMINRITQWVQINKDLIASQVTEYIKRFASFIESINWSGVINGIKTMVDWVLSAKEFFGGWKNVLIAFVAFMHADLIIGLLGVTKTLAVLGVQAIWTAGKIALMGFAGAVQSGFAFFKAMQFGVGVMHALKIAILANPLGLFIAALMAVGTAIYVYFKEPIDNFIANLDIVTPVKKMMREVAGLMPDWLQDKLGLNVETAVTDKGGPGKIKSTAMAMPSMPNIPGGLMAPPPSGMTPAMMQSMAGQSAQVIVTFDNAPSGMRVTTNSNSPGFEVNTELNHGMGTVGSDL